MESYSMKSHNLGYAWGHGFAFGNSFVGNVPGEEGKRVYTVQGQGEFGGAIVDVHFGGGKSERITIDLFNNSEDRNVSIPSWARLKQGL